LYGEALDYYRKALNTQARLQFSNNNALAEIFNNIGQTHLGLDQLDEAEQNLEEGIRIQKREPKHVQQHLALLYCNLGQVAYARHNYDEAEKNFQLSYDLYNRNTKISHDALEKRLLKADLCIAFGHLKSVQDPKDPTEASAKFTEALQIYESTLPPSHPKVAEAHIDIVCEYARNRNFQSVISYQDEHFLELLKDYEIKQTTSQQDLANLYAVIGACFAHEKKFDEAMENWKKAVEHEQKAFLDQLLSSARVSKIALPIRLVESAYRAAFDHYSTIKDPTQEYLAILYAKMYIYEQAINALRGQGSYHLANLCILQRNFKGTMVVYKRLLATKDYDLTLTIGILLRLLTAKKNTSKDEPIEELVRIEKTLARKIADNEAIRLRMIINDCLAGTYLSAKKYDDALQRSQISFELKQRHFSSNHPSLVSNRQLSASCCFQRGDYKNAVQYYEKAIEIQLDNMPGGHLDICSNYFLMGDCYCLMGKLELATDFYDRAQAPIEIDAEDEKETEQDVKALIRMHTNLANVYAKQKDFTTARSHQEGKINTLKEILPAFIVKHIETEEAASITFDQLQATLTSSLGLENGKTFAQILRNFVFICSSLARALLRTDQRSENDEDATDVYEQAIELELKLTMFERAEEKRLAKLYEELSNAYAKLYPSMQESIQENLVKALDETTDTNHQRSLEFQIGNLYFDEKNYSEADRFWKRALKKVPNTQTTVTSIIDKLVEKNKVNLENADEDSDDDGDDNDDEEASVNQEETEEIENSAEQLSEDGGSQTRVQSVKSQRRQSMKSVKSYRRQSMKSVNDKEKLDELAQAYLELEDYETALKYFKKHTSKLEETLKDSLPDIKVQDEQIPIVKFFLSLLRQNIISAGSSTSECKDIPNKENWSNLLQAYVKIITIAMRMGDTSDEMVKVHFAAFRTCQKLYDISNNLILAFDGLLNDHLDDLQWKKLLSLLSLNDSIDVLMKIAAHHTANEAYNDALEIYRTLQDTLQNNETLQSAVSYGLLKLFELHLVVNEEYRANIMTVDIRSPTIPIFDRIILCRLIVSFMREMEDETMIDTFEKELLDLQTEIQTAIDLETTDCIGHVLTKLEDDALACLYWTEVQNMCNEMLPQFIVTRLYSTESTFEEILRAVQDMNNDLLDNILALAGSYESIASYEEKDEAVEDACESLKKAIVIWSKVPSAKGKVEQAKAKMNTLETK
jgi:tetratricopeptide (TPR) repeat protein